MAKESPALPRSRTHYLDNLRTSLTGLVIIHHASIAYGGLGSWIYKPSRISYPAGSNIPILGFNVLNQTSFMALFFLVSGHFSAVAAEKRSRRASLGEKLRRLGVPTLVYSVVGRPIVEGIIAGCRDDAPWDVVLERMLEGLKSIRGVRGPVWYCGLLLIFDSLYTVVRPGDFAGHDSGTKLIQEAEKREKKHERRQGSRTISSPQVFSALSVTSAASFFLRLTWPSGTVWRPLQLNFGYLPQYLLFYSTGIYAHRCLETPLRLAIKRDSGTPLLLLLTVVGISAYGLPIVHTKVSKERITIGQILKMGKGGWNILALLYAVWNECVGVLISTTLVHTFATRGWLNRRWLVGGFDLARYSYAAFLVHSPVVVYVQCLLDGWAADAVVKSAVVGTLGCVGSWANGWLLVKALERMGITNIV